MNNSTYKSVLRSKSSLTKLNVQDLTQAMENGMEFFRRKVRSVIIGRAISGGNLSYILSNLTTAKFLLLESTCLESSRNQRILCSSLILDQLTQLKVRKIEINIFLVALHTIFLSQFLVNEFKSYHSNAVSQLLKVISLPRISRISALVRGEVGGIMDKHGKTSFNKFLWLFQSYKIFLSRHLLNKKIELSSDIEIFGMAQDNLIEDHNPSLFGINEELKRLLTQIKPEYLVYSWSPHFIENKRNYSIIFL